MFLTMYRTARSVYSRSTSDMLQVLFREGLLYYRCVGARILYIHHFPQPSAASYAPSLWF
jgi:hypothetical protein